MKRSLLLATALVCGSIVAANAQATRNPMGTETGPTMQRSNTGAPDVQGQSTSPRRAAPAPRGAMAAGKKAKKKKSARKSQM
jgi:hypothetical protein